MRTRQSELQKLKRQQRDAQLKKQAETRKKQQAKSDKKAARAAAAAEAIAAEASPEPAQQGQGRRKRLDRRSLPAMLPDDFLEAASDEDDEDQDGDSGHAGQDGRKPKKAKLSAVLEQAADAESRPRQDRRVGSTVYRVVTKQDDPILAPKPHNRSSNAREQLLARRRPVERKGGFLVKRR